MELAVTDSSLGPASLPIVARVDVEMAEYFCSG